MAVKLQIKNNNYYLHRIQQNNRTLWASWSAATAAGKLEGQQKSRQA